MFARALVVLLLILNLGVALWWITRDAQAMPEEIVLPTGAEPLRLLHENGPLAPVVPAADASALPPTPPAPPAPVAVESPVIVDVSPDPAPVATAAAKMACRSFGPFPDAAVAGRARAQLEPEVLRATLREARPEPKGWRVILPRQADAAAALDATSRLVAAGFTDHYRMPPGEDGRVDVALGRFGSEAAALRHQGALKAAGFDAVAQPIGVAGQAQYWIEVLATTELDVVRLRRAVGAAQAEQVDCPVTTTAL